jgi:predicted dehydrogenase
MSIERAPLRIGIAGFGRLARDYYLPALRTFEDSRLVGVADPLPASRAAATQRLASVDVYPDHRAMLERASLDAILVATPPSSHLEIWNHAAGRGVAVFMEKPFVLCGQLEKVECGKATSNLMLDFNRRFWPTYRRVAELVCRGVLGKPLQADFRLHVDLLGWSTVTRHRLSPDEGGILHDLGSHAVDLAADLLGEEPERVTAEMRSSRWPEDHLLIELAFADGSAVRCDLAYADRTVERLSVHGPLGTLRLDDPNMAIHREPSGTTGPRVAARLRDAAVLGYRALRRSRSMARFSIRSALDFFVRALRHGEPFAPGFEDAVRNVRWLEAAARSVAEERPERRPA